MMIYDIHDIEDSCDHTAYEPFAVPMLTCSVYGISYSDIMLPFWGSNVGTHMIHGAYET